MLGLIYQAYIEFNAVETLEFKAITDPLDEQLQSLVDMDEYINMIFELCPKAIGDIRGISYIYSLLWRFTLIDVPEEARKKLRGE